MSQVTIAKAKTHTVTFNFTRPDNTTTYTAGDVMNASASAGEVFVFPLGQGALASVIIQSATMTASISASLKLEGRLWLFDTTLTADNDNAEFTPTDAELRTLVQVIEFPAASWVAPGATSPNAACNAQNLWLPANTLKEDSNLYGVLEVGNAYIPTAEEVYSIRLGLIL